MTQTKESLRFSLILKGCYSETTKTKAKQYQACQEEARTLSKEEKTLQCRIRKGKCTGNRVYTE